MPAAAEVKTIMNGDLNNTSAMREAEKINVNPAFSYRSLALSEEDDDDVVRKRTGLSF